LRVVLRHSPAPGEQGADGFIELFNQDLIHGDSSPGSSKSQARETEVA
jgi:hypothetical protein